MAKFFETLWEMIKDANYSAPMNHDTPNSRVEESRAHALSKVDIQYMNNSGNWTTVYRVDNFPMNVHNGMQQLKRQYPNFRVRAAYKGQIVDMLP